MDRHHLISLLLFWLLLSILVFAATFFLIDKTGQAPLGQQKLLVYMLKRYLAYRTRPTVMATLKWAVLCDG